MNKLKVNFENCFGIGKLEHTFDFTKSNSFLVYAPNGTMKTSFTKTFDIYSKTETGEASYDRIYKERKSVCELLVDDTIELSKESILVINSEDDTFDATDKISTFIASKELKSKYDEIYSELDLRKGEFIKILKKTSQSSDCEVEFMDTFHQTEKDTFFDLLELMPPMIKEGVTKYDFKYNDIFDKKGNVKRFLEKNQTFLDQYIASYQSLLSKSKFFKNTKNSFGTYQANEILNSIKGNAFFEAGHRFILDGEVEPIDSAEKLEEIIQSEVNKIVNDEELRKVFEKVDKAIGGNVELRAFQKVIEKNNLLLIELRDYDLFKKKVWVSYFFELEKEVIELCDFYSSKKKDLKEILVEAKKELPIWEDIIDKFNSRFFVPFKVGLTNHEDVILKQQKADLMFEFKDSESEPPVIQDKQNLLTNLSRGEKRAYYILQFLFDVESRKLNGGNNLIILDDIADSFDYKNKYAIIEYIQDIHKLGNFRILILTHNCDFYRTITSRLYLGSASLMAIRNNKREISLVGGEYRKDTFKDLIPKVGEEKVFITLIPFVRNLIEYLDNDEHPDYSKLTECLHIKTSSKDITVGEIFEIYKNRLKIVQSATIDFNSKKVIDLIYENAESIIKETNPNPILLENKIVLSIAIRLKAEELMIKKITNFNIDPAWKNQTNKLFQEFCNQLKGSGDIRVLDRVNLMTPENIHLNAFMYEPLIDISIEHLINLYKQISTLS